LWLNQFMQSDSWKVFQRTSNELRNLPRNLMREANMEIMEAEKDLRRVIDPRAKPPASPPNPEQTPSNETESSLPSSSVNPTENNSDENASVVQNHSPAPHR